MINQAIKLRLFCLKILMLQYSRGEIKSNDSKLYFILREEKNSEFTGIMAYHTHYSLRTYVYNSLISSSRLQCKIIVFQPIFLLKKTFGANFFINL